MTDESPPAALFQVDPAVESRLAERLRDLRRRRDGDRAARALDAVERAARGTDNLVPRLLDAVQADVTLGEICARLRAVFGVHRPSVGF